VHLKFGRGILKDEPYEHQNVLVEPRSLNEIPFEFHEISLIDIMVKYKIDVINFEAEKSYYFPPGDRIKISINPPKGTEDEIVEDLEKLPYLIRYEIKPSEGELFFGTSFPIKPCLIGRPNAIKDYIDKNNLFPKIARDANISGVVLIECIIDENGIPRDIKIYAEIPYGLGFGEAAVEVMKAMRYSPHVKKGKPEKTILQQRINFTLDN